MYTHGFAGLTGGLLTGVFANSAMATAFGVSASGLVSGGGFELLKWQALTALWVIVFCAIGTYILLRVVKLFVPLRMTEEDMEEGGRKGSQEQGNWRSLRFCCWAFAEEEGKRD